MTDHFIDRPQWSTANELGLLKLLVCCLALCCQSLASAEDSLVEDWDITGFGTLGYAHSGKYTDAILKRNISQRSQRVEENGWLVDSRLGLQVSKEFNAHWDAVGQVVLQEKVDNSLENSFEMAFVRYQSDGFWNMRLGRMVLDTFLLSDYRNVGFSYQWVRPPPEFYGWIPFTHYDGIKTIFEFGDFDQFMRIEAYIGNGGAKVNIGYQGGGTSYNHAKTSPMLGMGVTWEKDNLTLRAYVTQFRISEEIAAIEELQGFVNDPAIQAYWPQASQIADDYALKGSTFNYHSLGFSWRPLAWQLQGELSHVSSDSFGTYGGKRGYLHFGRRFGTFFPHVTYSRSWDGRGYPYDAAPATPTPPLPAGTLEALEASLIDNRLSGVVNQYTASIGLRWDFASHKALKLQCERTKLYGGSFGIYPTIMAAPRDLQELTRSWCSTTFDWIF